MTTISLAIAFRILPERARIELTEYLPPLALMAVLFDGVLFGGVLMVLSG
jgi:hypothetical protein